MTKHSELPFIYGKKKTFQKSCMIYDANAKEVAVCRGDSILGNVDVAELIVTAVNNHASLVAALEFICNHIHPDTPTVCLREYSEIAYTKAEAALNKIKEKANAE